MEKMGTNDRRANHSLKKMMESGIKKIGMASVFSAVFLLSVSPFAAELNFSPVKNGKRVWRIGYYEPFHRAEYREDLAAMIEELMILGWVKKRTVPAMEQKSGDIWLWLSSRATSDYINFVGDAFYSGSRRDLGVKASNDLAARLNGKNDIDLIIAVGALSRRNIEKAGCKTPAIVISADSRASGVESSEGVYVCNPFPREERIRNFHDLIGFKKLGVAYENTVVGRNASAVKELEKVALERGFRIVSCYTGKKGSNPEFAENRVEECFGKLAEKNVDAIYIADQPGVTRQNIGRLSEIANKMKIKTFYQNGSNGVELGFLMSITGKRTENVGRLHAKTFAAKLNGATHGQLDRIYETPPKIAINIDTAEKIEFDPPAKFLIKADEVYPK